MSIFSSILARIFPASHPAVNTPPNASSLAPSIAPPTSTPTAGATAVPTQPVDVVKVLSERSVSHAERLNWRTSIVDLMKLLDLDSSLSARKELAAELHYGGDMNDSASMNIWLHKQVMARLAANGGRVPAELQ